MAHGGCGGKAPAEGAYASPYPLLSVAEAERIVLEALPGPLAPIQVPFMEALGKILAEDVVAADPLPPFPASIKVRT